MKSTWSCYRNPINISHCLLFIYYEMKSPFFRGCPRESQHGCGKLHIYECSTYGQTCDFSTSCHVGPPQLWVGFINPSKCSSIYQKHPQTIKFSTEICGNWSRHWLGAALEGFLKWGYFHVIHVHRIFHYKPSILWGTHMTMETPTCPKFYSNCFQFIRVISYGILLYVP